jgi:outer membrane protein
MVLSVSDLSAQLKIGHINTNDLIQSLPETDSIKLILQNLNDQLLKTSEELTIEYNKAYNDYQNKLQTMSDVVRQTKEASLSDMISRIQVFRENSQIELQKKQDELFEPIYQKAQSAIKSVAEEHGFDYILDTGKGIVLTIPKAESSNILPLVLAKLQKKTD